MFFHYSLVGGNLGKLPEKARFPCFSLRSHAFLCEILVGGHPSRTVDGAFVDFSLQFGGRYPYPGTPRCQ